MKKVYNLLTLILLMAIAVPLTARAAEKTETYTFTSKSWAASSGNWTGSADASAFNTSSTPKGCQITAAKNGLYITSPRTYSNVTNVTVVYSSSSKGVGSIAVSVGGTSVGSKNIAKSQTETSLSYSVSNLTGSVVITNTCTTSSFALNSVAITYDGGSVTAPDPPTISGPSAGTFDSDQTVTITNNASGATVYYTTDGSTPSSSIYEDSFTESSKELTFDTNGTYTVKAVAVLSGTSSSVASGNQFTIAKSSGGGGNEWTRVTSTSDLHTGSDYSYIIVCNGATTPAIMGTPSSSSTVYMQSITTGFTFNSDKSKLTISSAQPFIMELGETSGAWTFKNGDNYLWWNSGNSLNISSSTSTKTQWSISITSGNASIANGSDATRKIVYNSGSPRFACYTSAQTAVQLYYKQNSDPTICAAPTLSPAGGESSATAFSYIGATTVTASTTTDGATINYTIDGGSTQTGSSITLPATLGDHTIVVWASKDGLHESEHVTAYYKSVAPAAPTASPGNAGSTYNIQSATSVTLASANGGTIYYTTDGTEPSTSSTAYSSAITVNGGETIKAIAVVNGVSSDVASYEYVLALNPLAVSVSPAAGIYEGDTEISITTAEGYGTVSVFYTTDGTDPASSETRVTYTAPFTLSHSATPYTLRVYAEDSRPGSTGNTATFTGSYTINKATNVYKRIQNDTELGAATAASAKVIIGKVDGSAIMGPTGGNKYFASITDGYNYSGSNKTITITNAEPQYLTLGGTSGAYTLSNGGYYAAPNAGNTVAVQWSDTPVTNSISISDDETAQIIAAGGSRILGYNNSSPRFASYNSTDAYNIVALYWRAVTDLADVVSSGTVSEQYVIHDDLVGVFVPANTDVLYAKDFNKSRRPSVNEHGAKDYIGEVMGGTAAENYDQSTWVKIVGLADPSSYEGKTIIGGTLVVTLTDKVNPTITKTTESSEPSVGEAVSFSHQTYVPASFMGEYMTAGHGIEYFFVVPKPQEYVRITAAVYDGTKFIVPDPSDDENKAELTGGFDVDWTLLGGEAPKGVQAGKEYDLEGIVEAKTGGGAGARRKAMSASSTLKLVPTNIQAAGVITGIDGVSASRKAVRTRYYNISGMESDKPFQGVVNIIVVTYDDGSTFSHKVLF